MTLRLAIEQRRLDSGLTLLAVQNPGVATFAAGVMLDVDVRDERRGEYGLANLVGDCLDEGTERYTNLQLAAEVDKIGGTLEGGVSGGAVQCPDQHARRATDLLAEMVFRPVFPAREVRRVRDEIIQEIRADLEEPRTVASLRFRKRVYGRHPYGRPARGTEAMVAGFKVGDLRAFHRRNFKPDRGYVAAAGPAEPAATLDLLEWAFGGERGSRPPRRPLAEPPLPDRRREEHIAMRREQVHVYLGHIGVRRTDPDFYALTVMDHILGTGPGFTSRIAAKLRDEQGLCYAVDAGMTASAREEPGCFAAYIGTSPGQRQQAIDGFLAEMRRIRDTLPTASELRDVQDYLTGSFVWQFERNANLARYAVRTVQFDLGFDYIERYPDLIRSVTRQDVRRVAREHLHPDRVIIVSAGAT